MIIARDPEYQLVLPPKDGRRSEGIHVSDVLTDLYIRTFKPKWSVDPQTGLTKPKEDDPIDPMFAIRGWAFERVLSKSWSEAAGVKLNQVELRVEEDGLVIFLTPDWWSISDPDPRFPYPYLIEGKASDKTMNRLEDPTLDTPEKLVTSFKTHFKMWDWQIQCYLRNLHMVVCHLYVWWVRGDYKFGGPRGVDTVKRYILAYQVHELEETWGMMKNHARQMISEGRLR